MGTRPDRKKGSAPKSESTTQHMPTQTMPSRAKKRFGAFLVRKSDTEDSASMIPMETRKPPAAAPSRPISAISIAGSISAVSISTTRAMIRPIIL